jgi:hypothetical protein
VVSDELEGWLKNNSKGFEPAPHVEFFSHWNRITTLYGAIYPNIIHNTLEDNCYWDYLELLNNGFLESGNSYYLFYIHPNKKIVLNLMYTITLFWILLNFAISFYKKIDYSEEIIFQLSAIDVKECALGGQFLILNFLVYQIKSLNCRVPIQEYLLI